MSLQYLNKKNLINTLANFGFKNMHRLNFFEITPLNANANPTNYPEPLQSNHTVHEKRNRSGDKSIFPQKKPPVQIMRLLQKFLKMAVTQ